MPWLLIVFSFIEREQGVIIDEWIILSNTILIISLVSQTNGQCLCNIQHLSVVWLYSLTNLFFWFHQDYSLVYLLPLFFCFVYCSLSLCSQAWVANFERPRMNANSLLASPTGLSPYLRFGCLSCRLFYFKLTDLYRKVSLQLLPYKLSKVVVC